MKALEEEGFGKLVTREDMMEDEMRGFDKCKSTTLFFKPSPLTLDVEFIRRLKDPDLTENFYIAQFRKDTKETKHFPMIQRYHPNLDDLTSSQSGPFNEGELHFFYFNQIINCSVIYYITCNLFNFIFLEQENDPQDFQQLDGKCKSSLFTTKKSTNVEIKVSASTNNPNKACEVKSEYPEQKKDNTDPQPGCSKDTESASKPGDTFTLQESNFNVVASSTDMFSSYSENCDGQFSGIYSIT